MSETHDPRRIVELAIGLRDKAIGGGPEHQLSDHWASQAEEILNSRTRKAYLADMQGTARATFDNALYDLLSAALMMYRFRRDRGS